MGLVQPLMSVLVGTYWARGVAGTYSNSVFNHSDNCHTVSPHFEFLTLAVSMKSFCCCFVFQRQAVASSAASN